jgi:hypothetical protein
MRMAIPARAPRENPRVKRGSMNRAILCAASSIVVLRCCFVLDVRFIDPNLKGVLDVYFLRVGVIDDMPLIINNAIPAIVIEKRIVDNETDTIEPECDRFSRVINHIFIADL